jgi:hypothetical protein
VADKRIGRRVTIPVVLVFKDLVLHRLEWEGFSKFKSAMIVNTSLHHLFASNV